MKSSDDRLQRTIGLMFVSIVSVISLGIVPALFLTCYALVWLYDWASWRWKMREPKKDKYMGPQ